MSAKYSGRITFDAAMGLLGGGVAKMLERAEESIDDGTYSHVYRESIAAGDSEATAEEKAMAAESESRDDAIRSIVADIHSAITTMFGDHGMRIVRESTGWMRILPVTTWRNAAELMRDTINGAGPFYFRSLRGCQSSAKSTINPEVQMSDYEGRVKSERQKRRAMRIKRKSARKGLRAQVRAELRRMR